jgi:Protein of unknown function (Gmx_para_CXXCG)
MSYWLLDNIGRGPIEAKHRWLMPGIRCTVCNRAWSGQSLALPSVNLEGNPADSRLQLEPYPVSPATWLQLAEQIRPAVPPGEPIRTGLDLGPLKGRSEEPFRVTWYTVSGVVLSEEVRDEFVSLTPRIPLIPADIQCDNLPTCYEIEFRTYGAEMIQEVTDRCDACGYDKVVYPVDPKDYCIRNVPDAPLFTLRNAAIMIAHDRLIPFFERELGPKLKVLPIQVEM